MKKTLLTCLAIVALFAVASSASAIVCTIDQRPAATLLVPYFQVAFNSDGSPTTGAGAVNTLIAIGNASSAPMIAHVNVFNERSVLVLDFNVAMTGFDVATFSMTDVLTGFLPQTPISKTHAKPDVTDIEEDVCQRNTDAAVFPDPAGYLRIRPLAANTADPNDNTLATCLYGNPAWPAGGAFAQQVLGSLDSSPGSLGCSIDPSFPLSGPIRGYITIDHANYCNISDPTQEAYYAQDALGNEDNLFGEVIFTSGAGLPTFGASTVNIESSRVFDSTNNGGYFDQGANGRERTFYARYWDPQDAAMAKPNANTPLFATNPWNQSFGDDREPLGLRYAARHFVGSGVASYYRVWRASAGNLTNLTGTKAAACDASEPSVNLSFFDEDENGLTPIGVPPCPSPCTIPPSSPLNFPLEAQRTAANSFTLPPAFAGLNVGWASMSFVNLGSTTANNGGLLDQAWVEYEFVGSAAFVNSAQPASQLDPSSCHPLLIPLTNAGFTIAVPDALTDPVTAGGHSGLLSNPPIGTGP